MQFQFDEELHKPVKSTVEEVPQPLPEPTLKKTEAVQCVSRYEVEFAAINSLCLGARLAELSKAQTEQHDCLAVYLDRSFDAAACGSSMALSALMALKKSLVRESLDGQYNFSGRMQTATSQFFHHGADNTALNHRKTDHRFAIKSMPDLDKPENNVTEKKFTM